MSDSCDLYEVDDLNSEGLIDSDDLIKRTSPTPGLQEGLAESDAAGLKAMTASHGPLPRDFDLRSYLVLNRDIDSSPGSELRAISHFLVTGKTEGRGCSRAARAQWEERLASDINETPPLLLVYRSAIADRRRVLMAALGDQASPEAFTRAVIAVSNSVRANPGAASSLLEDVVIGRFLLSAPGAYRRDYESAGTQLELLFFAVAGCPVLPRLAVEISIVNRIARAATNWVIAAATSERPSLTLFMIAARAVLRGVDPAQDVAQPERAVAEFFARDVHELQLEQWVTPAQRVALRRPIRDGRPLINVLHAEVSAPRLGAGTDGRGVGASEPEGFWSECAWLLGLDYAMSGAQVAGSRVAVEEAAANGLLELRAPHFLLSAHSEGMGPEAAQEWLRRFVDVDREALGLPGTIVAPSALAHARRLAPPRRLRRAAISDDAATPGVRIFPGDLFVFGQGGNGKEFLVGSGWHVPEPTGTWSSDAHAQIAFRLDAPTDAALDLFVDIVIFDPVGETKVLVIWNGDVVSEHGVNSSRSTWTHSHLGVGHRPLSEVNTLILSPSHVRRPSDHGSLDTRRLGVFLRRMMLVAR